MNKELTITKTININTSTVKVWEAITNPEIIKKYFFGTEVVCDWKVGSSIIFQGDFQGQSYKDKGTIIKIIPQQYLQYDYWSGVSGLEDKAENYSLVTYEIRSVKSNTIVTVTQKGFANEQTHQHADAGWMQVLQKMKEIVEQ